MSPSIEPKHHDIYPAIDPFDPSSSLQDSAKGRTVIVTGAGRGIGRSIALNYAKANAQTIVITSRTLSQLDEVEAEIQKLNSTCKVIKHQCDVTDQKSVEELISVAVSNTPNKNTPYTLINNAGWGPPPLKIVETDPADVFKTLTTNFMGTYLPIRYLLPHLPTHTPHKNYIINISSIGSRNNLLGFSAYSPSKCAINRFTEFLHLEHGESHNLVTFAVHPGGVETSLAKEGMPEDKRRELLCDSPELMGGFAVWVGSGGVDWGSGRYLECNWDVGDILGRRGEVEGGELWRTVVLV
ncbi:hypothetical protein HDV00_001381 [Rhizophlyctis rosea]|nr:hypothetical protein HDV00_001381 [Rhizophlyctis rosea]